MSALLGGVPLNMVEPGQAPPSGEARPLRLGEVLVKAGALTQETIQLALSLQEPFGHPNRRRLGQIIIDEGMATEEGVAAALAVVLDLPRANVAAYVPNRELLSRFPRESAIRFGAAPLAATPQGVALAVVDPTDAEGVKQVERMLGERVRPYVVSPSELGAFLDRAYPQSTYRQVTQGTAVSIVDQVLADAIAAGVSDIHFEPISEGLIVRIRVDGMLREVASLPPEQTKQITSRLKIMFDLDVADKRLPQDGSAQLGEGVQRVDARISTMPCLYGEKVVIRVLGRAVDVPTLAHLGMQPNELRVLRKSIAASQGLVLVTGPTGSGKTTTLYSVLMSAADPTRNAVTLEDPVEAQLPGIVQTQIEVKAGLTFSRGLRSVLRQDPDVVLVGEIRDEETAGLAAQAASTGHLVFSSVHTTSSVGAIARLITLGVEVSSLAGSLSVVVGQRLVRRCCRACSAPYTPSTDTLELLEITELPPTALPRAGRGCTSCSGTGYLGRHAVFEVAHVTGPLRAALVAGTDELTMLAAARSMGMRTLREGGLILAARGITTYEEVLRATPTDLDR